MTYLGETGGVSGILRTDIGTSTTFVAPAPASMLILFARHDQVNL